MIDNRATINVIQTEIVYSQMEDTGGVDVNPCPLAPQFKKPPPLSALVCFIPHHQRLTVYAPHACVVIP